MRFQPCVMEQYTFENTSYFHQKIELDSRLFVVSCVALVRDLGLNVERVPAHVSVDVVGPCGPSIVVILSFVVPVTIKLYAFK